MAKGDTPKKWVLKAGFGKEENKTREGVPEKGFHATMRRWLYLWAETLKNLGKTLQNASIVVLNLIVLVYLCRVLVFFFTGNGSDVLFRVFELFGEIVEPFDARIYAYASLAALSIVAVAVVKIFRAKYWRRIP